MKKILLLLCVATLMTASARAEVIGSWSMENAGAMDRWVLTLTPDEGEVMCGFDIRVFDPLNQGLFQNNSSAFGDGTKDNYTSFLFHKSHEEGFDDVTDLIAASESVSANRLKSTFSVSTNSGAMYAAGFSGAVELLEVLVPAGSFTPSGLTVMSNDYAPEPAHFFFSNGEQGNIVFVPEPSTLALLVCGLAGLLAYAWRKRK